MGDKVSDMSTTDLANNLLGGVRLKDKAPEVLTAPPKLAAQISIKAKDMDPWAHAHSLRAALSLKDDTPEVLQMVPALVKEIPRKQASFDSQQICRCLEALILLQDSVAEVKDFLAAAPGSENDFVGFAAKHFSTLLPTLKWKQLEIPVVVWACARVNLYHEELLVSAAQGSARDLKALSDCSLCALLWSYDVLDPDGRFADFKFALQSEADRRGLPDGSDVSKFEKRFANN